MVDKLLINEEMTKSVNVFSKKSMTVIFPVLTGVIHTLLAIQTKRETRNIHAPEILHGCLHPVYFACILSAMDSNASFKQTRKYYLNSWSIEREKVLKELKDIRDYVQEQARIHSIANITYSSVGIVGGGLAIAGVITAPFTFGVSLGLTIAGLAAGVTSSAAGAMHVAIKRSIVNTQINNAKNTLQKHKESCKEMERLIEALQKDIKNADPDFTGVITKGEPLIQFTCSAIKDVENAVKTVATIGLSVTSGLGILKDLGYLIGNSVELSNINCGKLCDEANNLDKVIDELKKEYNELAKHFS